MEFGYGYDEPIEWWNSIITNPDSLSIIARHLFSICPNSASCERGFSNLGWLTNKRRLQLGIEKLETMSKMISYWKSNADKELGFYGKENKKTPKLSELELNKRITETLAEPDELNDGDDGLQTEEVSDSTSRVTQYTTSGEIIPNHDIIVLVEDVWIEKNVNLSNKLILENIGDIPEDFVDDLIDTSREDQSILLTDDENIDSNVVEREVLDYI